MSYKKSVYNVEVENLGEKGLLLYNTFTGIFGIMDIKTQSVFNNIEDTMIEDIADEDLAKNVDIMIKSGYIIPSELDELSIVKFQRASYRYNRQAISLTIAPTMNCNMCCPYCYENKGNIPMSKEIQERLIEFLKLQLENNKNLKMLYIAWYGGEPLLEKDIIYYLSKKFIELCEENDIAYEASIVTNGVLLDADTSVRLVNECKISTAQITIDGMKEIHNQRRIMRNGRDSFNTIINNIDNCDKGLQIGIRVNVDRENLKELEPLTKFFLEEKGWGENPMFYFAPVGKFNESCDIEEEICIPGREFASISNEYQQLNYKINPEVAKQSFFPQNKKSTFCAAEALLNYVIDPEGYFYNCWHDVGRKESRTGDIRTPLLPTEKYLKWVLLDLHEKCEKCEYLPLCQGGCGVHRLDGGEPQCTYAYYNYKDTLKLAYEDYILQKSKSA